MKPTSRRAFYEYPLRFKPNLWLAQIVVPQNINSAEANRLCAFIMTLVQPKTSAALASKNEVQPQGQSDYSTSVGVIVDDKGDMKLQPLTAKEK